MMTIESRRTVLLLLIMGIAVSIIPFITAACDMEAVGQCQQKVVLPKLSDAIRFATISKLQMSAIRLGTRTAVANLMSWNAFENMRHAYYTTGCEIKCGMAHRHGPSRSGGLLVTLVMLLLLWQNF